MSNGTRDFEEDGFHEIQLSGKQLVFLCMATTVVSIVIFLCGVLVGRGVRPVEPVAEAAAAPVAAEAPAIVEPSPAPAPPASTHASAAAAPASSKTAAVQAQTEPPPVNDAPPADELSYYDELSRKGGKKPAANAAAAANAAKAEAPKPVAAKTETPKPEPAKPAAASAGGGPVAVQVGAFGSRGEAEKLAKRLSGKGYAAYIVSPEAGGPSVFKVRVGNYQSADEADRVKTRLAREEKLKPWVIR